MYCIDHVLFFAKNTLAPSGAGGLVCSRRFGRHVAALNELVILDECLTHQECLTQQECLCVGGFMVILVILILIEDHTGPIHIL